MPSNQTGIYFIDLTRKWQLREGIYDLSHTVEMKFNQQPTTNNQQPTTNNQQPTTNNQQLASSIKLA